MNISPTQSAGDQTYESKIISDKALTDLETSYINRGLRPLNFDNLYNFKAIATSSLGYKHTEEARLKMVDYYKDKNNHPSPYLSFFRDRGFGKTHTEEALGLISKPGELNPMFALRPRPKDLVLGRKGKKHSEATKASMVTPQRGGFAPNPGGIRKKE
jgi:group I intron endonuclease